MCCELGIEPAASSKTRFAVWTKTDAWMRKPSTARRTLKPESLPGPIKQKPQAKDSKDKRVYNSLNGGDGQNKADQTKALKGASAPAKLDALLILALIGGERTRGDGGSGMKGDGNVVICWE